jgi:Family of unknown function (DUF6111)
MIRTVAIEFGFFIIPFVLYAAFLIATRVGLLHPEAWSLWKVGALTAAAVVLAVVGLVLFGDFSGAPPGSTYVPAHLENGKLVPGAGKQP